MNGTPMNMEARDGRFLATVATALALVVMVVTGRLVEPEPQSAGGARRVNAKKLERLVREGALSGHEALFFKPRENR